MDGSRFDGITRALATGQTRRRTLQGVAGSAIAGLLGLAGIEPAAAAKCAGKKKQCGGKCVNTRNDDKHCGRCNKKCKGQNTCRNGKCTSKRGCKAGQSFCDGPLLTDPNDPRICKSELGPVCLCVTDVEGIARCSYVSDGDCSNCKKNADCDPGFVCVKATGINCKCDDEPGSNGNACFPSNCEGVTGSSARQGGILRTPLLR